jgi:hypothetical protein
VGNGRRAALLTGFALAFAGCGGGTLGQHAFQKDTESIQSLAAEGALVAEQVADGHGTGIFTRVHALYLQKQAGKLERKLAAARTARSLTVKRRQAVSAAAEVDRDLGLLHRSPGNRPLAQRVAALLKRTAEQAKQLSQ